MSRFYLNRHRVYPKLSYRRPIAHTHRSCARTAEQFIGLRYVQLVHAVAFHRLRFAVSVTAAVALLLQGSLAPIAAQQLTRETYDACRSRDAGTFRRAIESLTAHALQDGLAKVDYRALVDDEWRDSNFGGLLDRRVDIAVGEVSNQTSLWDKGRSLFDKGKAQALSVAVAERVYRSDVVKAAMEQLAVGVAKQVGRTIELAASDAAGPAVACLKAFLGPRYGETVAGAVSIEADREFQVDPDKAAATVSAGAVLKQGSGGLAGVVILAIRRQLSNVARRVGQRLVGSVLGRLVSVVAGGIGLVLIAKDLWELRNGVLPIIATEMKSKATKDLVKDELATAIAEQINAHVKEIASTTADSVITIWHEFRRGHAKVLELTEKNAEFRSFVDTLNASDLPRLDEVVALLLPSEGEAAIDRRLRDGTLSQAVTQMSAGGMLIARQTRSLEQGLAWAALAGDNLHKVIEHGIYQRARPTDFTSVSLERLLGLDDKLAIVRLAGIDRGARDTLFELADQDLTGLARGVTERELETLSRYLEGLERPARERVLQVVANNPGRMQVLAVPRVRDAILASRDQLAAVSMMLRHDTGFELDRLRKDLTLMYDGKVSPYLIWDKHPIALIAGAIALVLVMLILRRLFGGRRRPPPTAAAKA